MFRVFAALTVLAMWSVQGLDNGLARTPPMGWLSWERFRCNTDCKADPDHCISERLYKRIADEMVVGGFKAAGYEYVCVDDCWLNKTRDAKDRLQADAERFPSGMKKLADYVHSKGLKFGIYEDFGKKTCAGYPGSEFFMKTDAETFAEWGVDLLKFDGCNSDYHDMDEGYPLMSKFLNDTGRPIVFSCEWPLYQQANNKTPDYNRIKQSCNIWRNFDDIQDSWESVKSIIAYYVADKGNFTEVAGPGGFNDPDMLIVGDFGLSYEQQKAQFGMWAMMASPLFMSVDLQNIDSKSKDILLNKNVIAINQDPLGIQARHLWNVSTLSYWNKPLQKESFAMAFLNLDIEGTPTVKSFPFSHLGLGNSSGYTLTEVFDSKPMGILKSNENITVSVNPTGILLLKAVPFKDEKEASWKKNHSEMNI